MSWPWRIHELTRDFRLEDVWAVPGFGGADDFRRLVHRIASSDSWQNLPVAVRTLFAIRRNIGELLGWDGRDARRPGMPTLRDRLPPDLREAPSGPVFEALPFNSIYLIDNEWAAEIANRIVHAVLHLGRVPDRTGSFRAQMAILVKPNGVFGSAYMAAIKPFRHVIVYPALLRAMGASR